MKAYIALILAPLVLSGGPRVSRPAEEVDEKAVKEELASLQGRWVMVGREALGKKATSEDLKKVKGVLVIEGEKRAGWSEEYGEKGDVQEATFKIDPAAK